MQKTRIWERKGRGFYVTLGGKQIHLGNTYEEATATYPEVVNGRRPPEAKPELISELIDEFLATVKKERAADTHLWYESRLVRFKKLFPHLLIEELQPFHVTRWVNRYDVSSGTKRNYFRSIMRCTRWALEQGLIEKNPLAHLKKPAAGVREIVITPEEFETILKAIKRQPFKDLVTFAWVTGARAKECLAIEPRHVDLANHRVVFAVDEEKMRRAPRVIYLTETAEAILKRLIAAYPSGRLFRNTDGLPWTTDAVNCAFIRLEKKLGKKVTVRPTAPSAVIRRSGGWRGGRWDGLAASGRAAGR